MPSPMLTTALLALGGLLSAAEAPPDFLLMALEPPPATRELYAAYAEAGLNTITAAAGPEFDAAAALAAEAGLSVLVVNPAAMEGGTAACAALAEDCPAIAGWLAGTNVTPADADAAAAQLEELTRLDTRRITLAFISTSNGERAATAERLLCTGLNAFGLRAFTLRRDGSEDRGQYFDHLARARELAGKHRARWLGFVQVTESGGFRFASESDLRFQVYSQLAFGARGLAYHRYWLSIPPEAWQADPAAGMRRSMVNPITGERHYTWEKVADVNREVRALWPVLRALQVNDVFFAGEVPPGMRPLPFGAHPIRAITAQSALVSFLRDDDHRDWAFVVNAVHGMQRSAQGSERTLRIQLDPAIQSIMEVERTTGTLKPVSFNRNEMYLTLPGGTGALLLLTPRETDSGAVEARPENAQ